MTAVGIIGLGSYLPECVVENAELELRFGLEPGWIEEKTGVRQRCIVAEDQAVSHLAAAAGKAALENAGIAADELDGIIVATTVPDTFCPNTACRVQAALGAARAFAFDVNGASSGFITALAVGKALIASGPYWTVLVIGAEVTSRFMHPDNYKTSVLFGDGAGAVVLRRGAGHEILAVSLGADGSAGDALVIPGGGAAMPPSEHVAREHLATLQMKGGDVFRFAMNIIGKAISDVLAMCGLGLNDACLIVPHQSNRRIIAEAAHLTGIPLERFFMNLDQVGNTSAASVPIALDEAYRKGVPSEGSVVVLVSYGAGLAWGAAAVRW